MVQVAVRHDPAHRRVARVGEQLCPARDVPARQRIGVAAPAVVGGEVATEGADVGGPAGPGPRCDRVATEAIAARVAERAGDIARRRVHPGHGDSTRHSASSAPAHALSDGVA